MAQALLLLTEVGSTAALLLVATYYLLASIPFSYYHFLQFAHSWWMAEFIRLHPLVALAGVAGLLLALRDLPPWLAPGRRYLAIAGMTTTGCMAATIWARSLQSFEVASGLCFLSIGVIAGGAWMDLVAHRPQLTRARGSHVRETSKSAWILFESAVLAGGVSGAAYLSRAMIVERRQATGLQAEELGAAALASVGGQVALFAMAALAALAVRATAQRRAWGPWRERLALSAGAAALLAWLIKRSVLSTLVLSELRAIALAAALGVTIVLASQAAFVRWQLVRNARGDASSATTIGIALLMFACIDILPDQLRLADWGFALQKLLVAATWVASVGLVRSLPDHRSVRLVLAGAIVVVLVVPLDAAMTRTWRSKSGTPQAVRGVDLAMAVDRYATIDTSLMVLVDLVRPVVSDTDFFASLRRAGGATDKALQEVPLRVTQDKRTMSSAPHVFIIVIDSLRPDYISAYNPDATFTPAIGAFARESLVWSQAFTPYTGTALSEPAIWAGGLIQRRMYVKPFSAVNNLEKFTIAGGYRRYISMDAILNTLLENRSNLVPLDSHLAHPDNPEEMFKFDLCPTLHELATDLDRDVDRREPIFFYSQPQNLHLRVLGGYESPSYIHPRAGGPAFFKPAVDAITRIDGCFGTFVDYLKAKRLFSNSLIVLTSDHGDAYGEGGLWGHAFYTVPATIRIPLIVHVPERLRGERYWDPESVALLTDVTPTLYALSGYRLGPDNDLVGRPLLTRHAAEAQAYRRDRYLIQSSYNLNFGLLDGHADWLYVASAPTFSEAFFDLHDPLGRQRPLPQADRLRYRQWLLDELARLNAYYVVH